LSRDSIEGTGGIIGLAANMEVGLEVDQVREACAEDRVLIDKQDFSDPMIAGGSRAHSQVR